MRVTLVTAILLIGTALGGCSAARAPAPGMAEGCESTPAPQAGTGANSCTQPDIGAGLANLPADRSSATALDKVYKETQPAPPR